MSLVFILDQSSSRIVEVLLIVTLYIQLDFSAVLATVFHSPRGPVLIYSCCFFFFELDHEVHTT